MVFGKAPPCRMSKAQWNAVRAAPAHSPGWIPSKPAIIFMLSFFSRLQDRAVAAERWASVLGKRLETGQMCPRPHPHAHTFAFPGQPGSKTLDLQCKEIQTLLPNSLVVSKWGDILSSPLAAQSSCPSEGYSSRPLAAYAQESVSSPLFCHLPHPLLIHDHTFKLKFSQIPKQEA